MQIYSQSQWTLCNNSDHDVNTFRSLLRSPINPHKLCGLILATKLIDYLVHN